MTDRLSLLDEPLLEFEGECLAADPRDGLGLFGALGSSAGTTPSPHAVIGTGEGIDLWHEWCRALNSPSAVSDPTRHALWRPFPSYEVAFGSKWNEQPSRSIELDRAKLVAQADIPDEHERCYAIVNEYLRPFAKFQKLDQRPTVVICVVPDRVWRNCRPQSRVAGARTVSAREKKIRRSGQTDFFDHFEPEQYSLSTDFRRQIKARSMAHEIPVQIVRESTLRTSDIRAPGDRPLTPLSDRLWNLSAALYYKSGRKPWRVRPVREGVCYIGIAFRRDSEQATSACCAAQMFVDSGDGLVFLGDFGPWYSPRRNQFHLTRDAARRLLERVLATHDEARSSGQPRIREVFLHSRSGISSEEFAGYQEACGQGVSMVGIRVRTDYSGLRLFRTGSMPVVRGTFLERDGRTGFLFASGFKPALGTYDGAEVPAPLRIDIQHGNGLLRQVATDILALTKLNYNSCRFGASQPVTVMFSDAVGEILIANKGTKNPQHSLRYYM